MSLKTNLQDLVALVTGGTKGIGFTVAEALSACGARVVITSRSGQSVQSAVAKLSGKGADCTGIPCDVSDENQVSELFTFVTKQYGALDILINGAGINIRKPLTEYTLDEWNQILSINLTGVFLMCRAAGRLMIPRRRGKVINIASAAGMVGFAGLGPYGSSKAGVIQLTRILAVEWASHGITVNAVAPSYVLTDLTEPLLSQPQRLEYCLSRTPLNRLGKKEEIAGAVLYLASEAADYVTGATIAVDGGMSAI